MAEPEAAAPEELVCPRAPLGQTEFLVSVPPGTLPGMCIQTATPDGQVITFTVPDDFVDGQLLPVFYTPLGRQAAPEIGPEMPPSMPRPKTRAEIRLMMQTFGDAKDQWKIDGQTMKGFYLHSESGYLYVWDQPTGVLYEYEQSEGQCRVVWKSALPAVNAEIWQVLPLPPTDPASMQASQTQDGEEAFSAGAFAMLSIAHESGRQLPADVLEAAAEDFCSRMGLPAQAVQRLRELPAAGQHFIIQNFRCEHPKGRSEAFLSYVEKLLRRKKPPWRSSACTLVVQPAGAILGRCCPDLDALCRGDPLERLAQAHCKLKAEQDRFFVCDLNTSEEGTTLDGFAVNEQWVGPLKSGSLLVIGPLRIKVHLSGTAKDTPLPMSPKKPFMDEGEEDAEWQRKVYRASKEETQTAAQKRLQEYKDRAEERRQRSRAEPGSAAIDGLVNKFNAIREAERIAEEAEERRVDMPTIQAHREANMATDGSFLGAGGLERAGIGFHSQMGAELIPNVLDPRNLSTKDASQLKMQMRYDQLNRQS